MKKGLVLAAVLSLAAIGTVAPANAGVEKLYILNCGEGVAGDISRWSPGVNEGKSMDFVDNCYLIKHSQGWFLWDTGITDAVADMPNGLAPADPKAVTWHRPKKLAAQLEQLGVTHSRADQVRDLADALLQFGHEHFRGTELALVRGIIQ